MNTRQSLAVFSLLLLVGCGPQSNTSVEQGIAPKSPISYEDGLVYANTLALITGGKYSKILPTGSMAPLLDSSSIPIYVKSDGSDIAPGMIVSYTREGNKNVLHQV